MYRLPILRMHRCTCAFAVCDKRKGYVCLKQMKGQQRKSSTNEKLIKLLKINSFYNSV